MEGVIVRSSALQSDFYGDPADVIERLELDALGCRACVSHKVVDLSVSLGASNAPPMAIIAFMSHLYWSGRENAS